MVSGIIQIAIGLAGMTLGLTADKFYAGFMRRPRPNEKPMPKWLGRTIFVVVGMGFIYSGVRDILRR